MKLFITILILIPFIALISGCMKKSPKTQVIEGGLYAIPKENNDGYNIMKILKIEDNGYHVRIYSNVFKQIPNDVNVNQLYMVGIKERKENEILGMGHLPISKKTFESYQLFFVKKVDVTEEELEGYRMWQEAKGGYF